MSKIYSTYLDLKEKNSDTILLFKSGIFFIAIDKDADYLSNLLGLKLTNLNNTIKKCGFPCSSLDKYLRLFKACQLEIKIIETTEKTSYSLKEYEQKNEVLEILNLINNIDINNLSVSEAYGFIEDLKTKAKEIC